METANKSREANPVAAEQGAPRMSRREFMKKIVFGSGASVAATVGVPKFVDEALAFFGDNEKQYDPVDPNTLKLDSNEKTDYEQWINGLLIEKHGEMKLGQRPEKIVVFLNADRANVESYRDNANQVATIDPGKILSVVMARPGARLEKNGKLQSRKLKKRPYDNDGRGRGEWGLDELEIIAPAIKALKDYYGCEVFVAGHSGGAVLGLLTALKYKGLLSGVLAGAGPPNAAEWINHLNAERRKKSKKPTQRRVRMSAHEALKNAPKKGEPGEIPIYIAMGDDDDNVPPYLADSFTKQAEALNIAIRKEIVPGKHNAMFDSGEMANLLREMLGYKPIHLPGTLEANNAELIATQKAILGMKLDVNTVRLFDQAGNVEDALSVGSSNNVELSFPANGEYLLTINGQAAVVGREKKLAQTSQKPEAIIKSIKFLQPNMVEVTTTEGKKINISGEEGKYIETELLTGLDGKAMLKLEKWYQGKINLEKFYALEFSDIKADVRNQIASAIGKKSSGEFKPASN